MVGIDVRSSNNHCFNNNDSTSLLLLSVQSSPMSDHQQQLYSYNNYDESHSYNVFHSFFPNYYYPSKQSNHIFHHMLPSSLSSSLSIETITNKLNNNSGIFNEKESYKSIEFNNKTPTFVAPTTIITYHNNQQHQITEMVKTIYINIYLYI